MALHSRDFGRECRPLDEALESAKVVVFDFDDTLFTLEMDWDELKRTLSEEIARRYNVERSFNPLVETVDEIRLGHKRGEEIFNTILEIVNRHEMNANHRPLPDAVEILKDLKNRGKNVAVFTLNTRRAVKHILDKHGLSNYIDHIVCFEDVKWHKPQTEGLDKIKEHFGVDKEDIVFIGNSERDMECGVRFDVDTYDISFVLDSTKGK